ncbi:MAG: sugar kinase [Armatimonadetes bacterium]|nr:sugar kinase [Armatimonadota bacterium]
MFDVVTVGSATEDVFVVVRDTVVVRIQDAKGETAYLGLEHGAKVAVDDVEIMTGGGATNTAVGLARMGLKTACVSKLGRDGPGERIEAELRREGVDTSLLAFSSTHRTGYSVIITCFSGERTVLTYRGAAEQLAQADLNLDVLLDTQWLFVGSMRGPAAALFFELPKAAAARGVKVAANPGGTQLALGVDGLRPVLANLEVIFLNKREAYQLTGIEPDPSRADEYSMLRLIAEAGCRKVVITDGEEGADGYDEAGPCYVPAYPVKVASTVGAGDAFACGCIAGLVRGLSLVEAMKVGAANAASVVQHIGAKTGLLSWEEAAAFVASHCRGK